MAKKEIKVLKTIEEWREIKMPVVYFEGKFNFIDGSPMIDYIKDKSWLFESAKTLNGWPKGEVLTEEEFDLGIKKAADHYPGK